MIKVNFLKLKTNEICGFKIDGHAGYAEYGKDIVCAAVSSAVYMVANTITDVLNIKAEVKVEKTGYIYLKVPNENLSDCKFIFKGLEKHIISMSEDYSKNIKVNYEEVT